MNPIIISSLVVVCCICGAHLGMFIRTVVPEHHLTEDTREIVKLGAGLIATLTALVLGLLISSAKDTLDTMNRELTQDGARVILLDRSLAGYGPETAEIRAMLRGNVSDILNRFWKANKNTDGVLKDIEQSRTTEMIQVKLNGLAPNSENQRLFLSEAKQICAELIQSRWFMIEQSQHELPKAFMVILLLWFIILYVCYGLITPRNGTVRVVLLVSALSVAGAIFLIIEMNTPLSGIIKVSSAPLHKALSILGI